MKTKVIKRKWFKTIRFEIVQTHWFYIIPTFMFNHVKFDSKLIRFQWLFWEIDYAWNCKEPCSDGNKH